jgi:hypothetical protein
VLQKSVSAEDVATPAAVNLVSTVSTDDIGTPAASPADADNDPEVEPNDSSDGLAPGLKVEEGNDGGDEADAS